MEIEIIPKYFCQNLHPKTIKDLIKNENDKRGITYKNLRGLDFD